MNIKIKVRNVVKGGIKTLKKGVIVTGKVKDNIVDIKDKSNEVISNKDEGMAEYSSNKFIGVAQASSKDGIKKFNHYGRKSFINTKKNAIKFKNRIAKKQTEKKYKRNIKNAKENIKNTTDTIKSADRLTKETIKNSRRTLKITKESLSNAIRGAKVIVKTTVSSIKAIIIGTKALIELLLAGGWIAVVIIIVICLFAWLCTSSFGIFFSNEKSDNNLNMITVIGRINDDINNKIEEIKQNNTFDECIVNSNIANWKEVLAFYSVYTTSSDKDVITLDEKKVVEIKKIFWEFNSLTYEIKEDISNKKILEISVISRSITEIENKYNFSYNQREEVKELLSTDYESLWKGVINNSVNEKGWIFPVKNFYVITTYYSSSHQAIDIASNYNTNIYSIADGTVIVVKDGCVAGNLSCNGKAGNYITISHSDNEYYSQYMHLNTINVSIGDKVKVGDVIGTMGNTGNVIPVPKNSSSTEGTHLHFVLQKESERGRYNIDPNLYYNY